MILRDLISCLDGCSLVAGSGDTPVTNIEYDSRRISSGDIFVALKGQKTDGHDHIEDAVSRGASVICVEKDIRAAGNAAVIRVRDTVEALADLSRILYGTADLPFRIHAVTGTNGKTTITWLLRYIAEHFGSRAAVLGTLGVQAPGISQTTGYTTPMSSDIHRILPRLAENGVEHLFMEASSFAAVGKRLRGISFDSLIFTNLSRDHLDIHGSMENYYQAKKSLAAHLKPGASAFINLDDEYGRRLYNELELPGKKGFSIDSTDADLHYLGAEFSPAGFSAGLSGISGEPQILSSLLGTYNASNLLAAVGCWFSGSSAEVPDIIDLRGFTGAPGRMEIYSCPGHGRIIVDFAHTPDAMENIFRSLVNPGGSAAIAAVFGAGGDRDAGKRPVMGATAERYCSRIYLTNDNPRSEEPMIILEQIAAGISGHSYSVIEDRTEAIAQAVADAGPEDITLILGKGGETFQEIMGKKLPYSDSETVQRIIRDYASR